MKCGTPSTLVSFEIPVLECCSVVAAHRWPEQKGRLASKLRGRLGVIVPEQEQEKKDVDRNDRGAGRTTNYERAGSDLWAGASNATGNWRLATGFFRSSRAPESDEPRERERGGPRFRVGVRVKVRVKVRDRQSQRQRNSRCDLRRWETQLSRAYGRQRVARTCHILAQRLRSN